MKRKKRFSTALCALSLTPFALLHSHASAAAAPSPPQPFSIMTYNVMLLPSGLTDWEPDKRARAIGTSPHLAAEDVLVLSEMFDNSASDELLHRTTNTYPQRTPVIGRSSAGWDKTTGGYYGTPLEDGGVAILSKWPILRKEQHIFGGGCGADYWAAKGFAYAVVNISGQRVHVIGTHLQANDSGCSAGEAAQERSRQLGEITQFLESKRIPREELIAVAGDFNIRKGEAEHSRLLETLKVSSPQATAGAVASHDPATNSVAHYRDPGSRPSRLDYVFLKTGGSPAAPPNWVNKVDVTHTAPFRMHGRNFSDLSDHYPVRGFFDPPKNP
nr:sphingomyelin phosphodiesterase [Streptomyces chartreusis]